MTARVLKYLLFTIFFAMSCMAMGQVRSVELSGIQKGDTIRIDSLSIIPSSVNLIIDGDTVSDAFYVVDGTPQIVAKKEIPSATIYYSTLPLDLSKSQQHKDRNLIHEKSVVANRPLYTLESRNNRDPIFFEGLNKSGSLSRGITGGNNQDAVLSSNLNLQLSGNINPSTTIRASITDNQIPVYAEGISQSLQEFDRVFIEVENESFGKIRAGDFDIGPSGNYFLRFQKRISGAGVESPIRIGDGTLTVTGVGALARGEFNRNTFRGQEGNQGPYKLTGKNNELVILVISGSERVYIDGKQLVRGLENDYVIDYTTGEVTFTSLRPITKDHRIVVEFQYTVQNYVRSIGYGGLDWKSDRWDHRFFIYSEQDAKNQPISSLSNEEIQTLSEAGDDPLKAVSPSWNEQEFDANKILYRITDSLGFDSVFVYSTNPDDTLFQVFFSFVGQNRGNYVPISSSANGQVYAFVPPVGGQPQGTHIPYTVLPAPELIQVMTYAGRWKDRSGNGGLNWEMAYSHNDPNRFSEIDNGNHRGIASRLGYGKEWKSKEWKLSTSVEGEYQQEEFETVERIRNVEFARDWNLSPNIESDLWLGKASFRASKKDNYNFFYRASVVDLTGFFSGIKNDGRILIRDKGWWVNFNGSLLLTSDTLRQTQFFRQRSRIQKNFESQFYIGVSSSSENNLSQPLSTANDISYRFLHLNGFAGFGDTTQSYAEVGLFRNTDDTVRTEVWNAEALATGAYIRSSYRDQKTGTLLFRLQSRELITYGEQDERLRPLTIRPAIQSSILWELPGMEHLL